MEDNIMINDEYTKINPFVNNNVINHTLYFYNNPNIINITYRTINGILDGEYLLFDKHGKLISKAFYINGKLCGIKTDYNVCLYLNNEIIKVKKYEQVYENGVEMTTSIIF
jgi:antitoxin component YwqK of YwqJK toxin-antitoxin module